MTLDGSALAGDWGCLTRAEQLRRAAEQRGLRLEPAGYEGDRRFWLLVDVTTSRVVAGLDSGRPDMGLPDVQGYLATLAAR
jgi:hypothetical protein